MTHLEPREHLLGELLPLWREHGVDRAHGGFVSRLDSELRPVPDDSKRLLVQTRQVHVFARAHLDGAGPWALETAEQGMAFLRDHFLDPLHGGWYLSTTLDGEPKDTSKDCYAHAFVLLALATLAQAGAAHEPLALAEQTLERLDRELADPEHDGYLEGASRDWKPQRGSRRQNPHMHLFEALLALHEASAEPAYLERATRLLQLLRTRFVDAASGALLEHFGPDWSAAADARGRSVEPGHHFEWSWLLARYAAQGGNATALGDAERLHAFAVRHGLDPESGGVFDEVDPSGRVLRASQRLWPQTEHLHALAARAEAGDREAAEKLPGALSRLLDRYRDPAHGGWREQADASGRIVSKAMNATSVYHVYGALQAAAPNL